MINFDFTHCIKRLKRMIYILFGIYIWPLSCFNFWLSLIQIIFYFNLFVFYYYNILFYFILFLYLAIKLILRCFNLISAMLLNSIFNQITN